MSAVVLAQVGDLPEFLPQSVAIVLAAAVVGYLSVRVRVVPIVGFLVAGVLIGPHGLGLVQAEEAVEQVAEIGIVLLLFTIGIEFSLERLQRIRRLVLVGGTTKVVLAVGICAAVVLPFGVEPRAAIFTGFLVAISSTAIALKVLASRGEITGEHGQFALGLLIFEDLAAVLMVMLVPVLAGAGGGGAAELARVLLTAVAIVAAVLYAANRGVPPLLEIVARACSPEVFLLSVLAICLGAAYLTTLAGVSVSLGAFLAGLLVSESRHAEHALGEILPLQIIFTAAFFLSIGMLLDVRFLLAEPLLVAAAVAIGLVIPLFTTAASGLVLRVGGATTILTATLLAQVSEFAFVVERAGAAAGLSPAGLGDAGSQAFIAATVLLMAVTPAVAAGGRWFAARLVSARAAPAPGSAGASIGSPAGSASAERPAHVLISGWGDGARHVAAEVVAAGFAAHVVTLNPEGAAEAEAAGHAVVRGDSTRQHVLAAAGVATARLVVIADDDWDQALRIADAVSRSAPGTPIAVRSVDEPSLDSLLVAGVTHVVSGQRAGRVALAAAVLAELRGTRAAARTVVDPARIVRFLPEPGTACPHTADIVAVQPSSSGCEDCLRSGEPWVHLRICLTCGYVGCCDSSRNRHATRHAAAVQHPILASAEPGEGWAWCARDSVLIEPARSAR